MARHYARLLVLLLCIVLGKGHFSCICFNGGQKSIYATMERYDKAIGLLYDGDCLPKGPDLVDPLWLSVQYQHQIAYIEKDASAPIKTCSGNAPTNHLATAVPTTATAATTTTTSTTTLPSPTSTITTTPITTTSTTLKPTTTTPLPSTSTATTSIPTTTTSLPTTSTTTTSKPTTTTPLPTTSTTTKPIPKTTTSLATTSTTTKPIPKTTTPLATTSTTTTPIPKTTTPLATTSTTPIPTSTTPIPTTIKTTTPKPTTTTTQPTQTITPLPTTVYTPEPTKTTTTRPTTTIQLTITTTPQPNTTTTTQPTTYIPQPTSTATPQTTTLINNSTTTSTERPTTTHRNTQDHTTPTTATSSMGPYTQVTTTTTTTPQPSTTTTTPIPITSTHKSTTTTAKPSTGTATPTTTTRRTTTHRTTHVNTTPTTVSSVGQYTQVQYGCPQQYFQNAQLYHGTLFTLGSTCYEIVQTQVSWPQAEADCVARGGHLAHIPDQRHQDAINQVTSQHLGNDVWIGLNDMNEEQHYAWSSESTISTVFAAATTMPQVSKSDGDIQMCPGSVQQEVRRYNYPLAQHGDSCYELQTNKVIWAHSESLCKIQGGHLVAITSAAEQAFVDAFMVQHNPGPAVWIGLHDRNVEGQFEWTSGESVTYTNWVPNHMNNFESYLTEDCIALIPNQSGQWDDMPCGEQYSTLVFEIGEKHYTFCEYKLSSSHGFNLLVG